MRDRILITDDFLDSLISNGKDQFFTDTRQEGFNVRVTANGTIIFRAVTRHRGEQHKLKVGTYPDINAAAARNKVRTAIADIKQGKDPNLEAAARKKIAEADRTTVEALSERWMREIVKPKRKRKTEESYQSLIDQKIVPKLGHLFVGRITREDVITWHGGMADTPPRANRALAVLKTMLHHAEDVGLRPPHSNPCRRIEMYREKGRERFLSEAEIAKAAEAITKAEGEGVIGPHAAAGLRLALFSGARSGEVTAAKWEHFHPDRKLIRLPDSKTNEPRTIHLNDAALEVLAAIKRVGPYIVAGAKKGEPFKNLGRSWIVARAYVGLNDVRLHDLRHSYASLAASRGVSLPIIGKLLGHKVPATTQRYAHLARDVVADINDQLGAAMTAAIQKPTPVGGNVVKLPKRRRVRP